MRNNSPPAQLRTGVPVNASRLLHTIPPYSDYVNAGLENLTSTWLVRRPSILQFTAAMREYALLVRTKYHHPFYGIRPTGTLSIPYLPCRLSHGLPFRKMGSKMPHIEYVSGVKRGETMYRYMRATCSNRYSVVSCHVLDVF